MQREPTPGSWSPEAGGRPAARSYRPKVGILSCIQALPTALSNVWSPLGMSNTNAMKQLRGPKHENWPVCDPRAAPPEEYGLKSGENGHLARANGAIDGPYCSPTWPSLCLEGGVSRWLVGVVGLGAELHQRPHAARWALLPFECLRKTQGTQAVRHGGVGRLCAGCLG